MRYGKTAASLCVVASLALLHAGEKDFWSKKPYDQWDQKEVSKLLKDSPWAKSVLLSVGAAPQGGGRGGRGGGRGGGGGLGSIDTEASSSGGSGGSGGDRGGGIGSESQGSGQRISIGWFALPFRQAMARSLLLHNPETQQDRLDKLLKYENKLTMDLVIYGWSMRGERKTAAEINDQLRKDTYLLKKNKERIMLANLVLPAMPGQALVLQFSRQANGAPTLTLEDKEVELVTKMGGNTIRTRFKLSEMVLNGQLEL